MRVIVTALLAQPPNRTNFPLVTSRVDIVDGCKGNLCELIQISGTTGPRSRKIHLTLPLYSRILSTLHAVRMRCVAPCWYFLVGTSCLFYKFLFQSQEEPDEDKQLLKVADPQEAKELKDRIGQN